MADTNGHLKWAGINIGVVIIIVSSVFSFAMGCINEQDKRLRQVERDGSAIQAQLTGMQRTLDKIDRKLERIEVRDK